MLLALRLCSLCALLLSSAAAVDYYGAGGHGTTFCGAGSGCDTVRHSSLGETIGVALPAIGLAGFALVLLGSLARGRRLYTAALAGALTGGIAGALLLALQALIIGTFCWLCVGVDAAAILTGTLALGLLRRPRPAASGHRERGLWAAAAVLAVGAPFAWAATQDTELPAYIASLGEPGKINVVEISDFECPHCRAMHPHLDAALEEHAGRVHFVRKSYPLPSHRHARDAARAYVCAQAQDSGAAMADALFAMSSLSPGAIEQRAAQLELDLPRFTACVAHPDTDRAIDRDMARIREAGFEGLPTVWIGREALIGFDRSAGAEPYRAALQRAASGKAAGAAWRPWALTLGLAALAFAVASARRTRN